VVQGQSTSYTLDYKDVQDAVCYSQTATKCQVKTPASLVNIAQYVCIFQFKKTNNHGTTGNIKECKIIV